VCSFYIIQSQFHCRLSFPLIILTPQTVFSHLSKQSLFPTTTLRASYFQTLKPAFFFQMGLIKTAIMTGGGIYAVDKIAKASLHRNDSPTQHTCQRCGYTNGSNQNGWGPSSGPTQRGPPQNDYYQDQRQFSPEDQGGFLPTNQQRGSFSPPQSDDEKRSLDAQYQQMQGRTPPPYNQQK